jgi:hypothetical protein
MYEDWCRVSEYFLLHYKEQPVNAVYENDDYILRNV